LNLDLPDPLLEICNALEADGHRTWLVGAALHACMAGARRPAWALATDASPEQINACLPHAVQVRPAAAAFVVPSALGPIDLQPLRNGDEVEADLAHRDFTLFGMAYRPRDAKLIDPYGGVDDLSAGVLRAIGEASERLAEDPVRIVRAARCVAEYGYTVDPALEDAMCAHSPRAFDGVAAMRIRAELMPLLMGAHVGAGLALLQRCDAFGPRLQPHPDSAPLVQSLPARAEIRWTAWLQFSGAGRALRWLRIPQDLSKQVLELLQLHPIEDHAAPNRVASLKRIRARLAPERLSDLMTLRGAEIDQLATTDAAGATQARGQLDLLVEAFAAQADREARELDRPQLEIDGGGLMAHFGWPPGPGIGRALRYLEGRVREDPSLNERPRLIELLAEDFEREPS
jgi:tRNA nucleotidyltransferase (CCA-adding enzyme)